MNIIDLIKKKSQAEAAMARQAVQRVKSFVQKYPTPASYAAPKVKEYFKPAPQVRVRDVVREIPNTIYQGASGIRKNIVQPIVEHTRKTVLPSISDVAMRTSPIEPVRNLASGFQNIARGNKNTSVLDRLRQGILESQARKTYFEKANDVSLTKPTGGIDWQQGRKFIGGAMEAPTYFYSGLKGFIPKGNLVSRVLQRILKSVPEAGINTGTQLMEDNINPLKNPKEALKILGLNTALMGVIGNAGELKGRPAGLSIEDVSKKSPLIQEGVTSSSTKPTSKYTPEQSIQNIGNRKPGQPATQGAIYGMPQSSQTSIPPKNVSYNPNTNISTKNVNPRGFIETVRESNKPMGKVAQKVDSYYNTAFQKETLEAADRNIAKDFEGAVHRAKTETRGTKQIQAESMRLMDELQAKGRTQDAIDILEKVSERGTESGQAINILNAYQRLTPEGILMTAQRQIKKAKELNPNKYGNLKLKTEDAVRLRKMAEDIQGMAGEAKDTATRAMLEEIERLVPTPWARKVTTLWKAGLLTSVKGAVGGNTVGNTTMAVLRKVSDVPASMIDNALSVATGNRSKVFTMKGLISGAWEGVREGISNMRKGIGANDLANKLDYNKVYFGKGKLGTAAQKYTDTVFNFYSAADRPFYHSALKNTLYDLATVEAKNRKLTGGAAKDFINKMVKEPTDEILTQAVSAAQKAVFQGKNMMGSALSGLKKGMKKYGPTGEILSEGALPFTGVPSAIASAVHNYSPTGAIAGVYRAIVQAKNGGLTQSGQRALSEALGKGLTGTAAIWLGMKLTETGQMTLGYPTDAGERSLWEQEGKIPYAIKINGKWRSLNYMGPVMSLLSIGGEIQKADSKGVEAIAKGTLGSGKAILSSSPLQGMQAGMDAITDPQRYGDSYMRNQASSIIPTLIKDFAVAGDPTQRESNTVGEAIRSKIPWMRNNLLPKRDIFGQEVPRNTSAIGSVIDPFRSSEAKTTPLVNELRRLQDASYGPTMSKLSKDQTVFGQKIQLNPQELDKLEQANQRIKPLLEQIITSREYQSLDDEEKQKLINSVINDTRKESRESSAMGNNQPMIDTGKLPEKYQKEMQQKSLANDIISGGGVEAVKKYKPGTLTTSMITDLYENGDIDTKTKFQLTQQVNKEEKTETSKYIKDLLDQDRANARLLFDEGLLTESKVDDMYFTGTITGRQALALQEFVEKTKWKTGQKQRVKANTYNKYVAQWKAKYGGNAKPIITNTNTGLKATARETDKFPFPDYPESTPGSVLRADLNFENITNAPKNADIVFHLKSPNGKVIDFPQTKEVYKAGEKAHYGLEMAIPKTTPAGQYEVYATVNGAEVAGSRKKHTIKQGNSLNRYKQYAPIYTGKPYYKP